MKFFLFQLFFWFVIFLPECAAASRKWSIRKRIGLNDGLRLLPRCVHRACTFGESDVRFRIRPSRVNATAAPCYCCIINVDVIHFLCIFVYKFTILFTIHIENCVRRSQCAIDAIGNVEFLSASSLN